MTYVLSQSELGEYGVDSQYVDGTFLDDINGIPNEHQNAPANMGLTPAQVDALQASTNVFAQSAITTLAAQGKYVWQAFGGMFGGPSQSSCAAYMARVCSPSWQAVPWTVQWDGTTPHLPRS